ncbi:F-actin-capping protein subunit alpha, partial [Syncephalis pseudoplumigaleata]
RHAIQTALAAYTADRYPEGVAAVFATGRTMTMVLVGNKYNAKNFWNGRWRSVWTWHRDTNVFRGTITTNVHYYEDGNVQLASSKSIEESVASTSTPDTAAEHIVKRVAHAEDEYQRGLNAGYAQLSGHTFKSLRRTLPVTRSKLNWDKIANYKIGAELTKK